MSDIRAVRAALVKASQRYSRITHEAEDVAHDVVLSALRRGLSLSGERFVRSTHAATRQHAAFLARSAGRRRARELELCLQQAQGDEASAQLNETSAELEGASLSVLSPALRTTLLLLCLGLDKAELRVALGVTDPALRKRFQVLRDQAPLPRPKLALPTRSPALAGLRRAQVRLLPQLAAAGASRPQRVVATSDPDGHGLIFAQVLTLAPGAATRLRSATASGRT